MRKKSMISLILMIIIGFASVSTTLIINGLVGIDTNTDNYIDGLVFDKDSLRSSTDTTAKISESGRTISFTTNNMMNAGEEASVYFKIRNYSQYNATLGKPAIVCYFVDSHQVDKKAISIGMTHDYIKLIPGTELDGDTINAGGGLSEESSVTVRQTKSYTGDASEVKFQCEINSVADDSEVPSIVKQIKMPEGYYLTNDIDNNREVDVGDEIRVGTESFYVISIANTEIKALAKYNLKVGNVYSVDGDILERTIQSTEEEYGKQDSEMRGWVSGEKRYGTVVFANQKGWSANEDINIREKSYADGPIKTALYGENGYEKYLQQTIDDVSVRLITKKEIEILINNGKNLGYQSINTMATEKNYTWIYSTSYWTQTAYSNNDLEIWRLSSGGIFNNYRFNGNNDYGIRPVIIIHLSINSSENQ